MKTAARGQAVALALVPLAAPALAVADVAAPARQVLRVHYGPREREAGRYQYVPVDVAEGATRLRIAYAYDHAEGGNVVDLGLFEPGPLELGRARCRGWSGGERSEVTVSTTTATPGYWPGPLPAGRWHVAFGLYQVAPQGVDVELTIETSQEPEASASPAATPCPGPAEPRAGPAWYRGDLHTHTVHSDGKLTVAELVEAARAAGLEFIAITDHNNTTHQADGFRDPALLTIVGEEITTPGGHANAWGLGPRDFVDFRVRPGDPWIEELARGVAATGAVLSLNHPTAQCAQCGWEHAVPAAASAIEIWNGWSGPQEAAVALWDRLLRSGRRLTAVGSSDFHRRPQPLGRGSVRVWAPELRTPAILRSIREGRVIVMGDGSSPAPMVLLRIEGQEAGIGDTVTLRPGQPYSIAVQAPPLARGVAIVYWNGEKAGEVPLGPSPSSYEGTATGEGYVRVLIRDASGGAWALTNPVFVKIGRRPAAAHRACP
jgi:hypothetical protein